MARGDQGGQLGVEALGRQLGGPRLPGCAVVDRGQGIDGQDRVCDAQVVANLGQRPAGVSSFSVQ